MANYKSETYQATLLAAIQQFYGEAQALGEQLREIYDDMSEKAQEGERGEAYDNAATGFEEIEQSPLPPALKETGLAEKELTLSRMMLTGADRGRERKATLRDNAANSLEVVCDALNEWLEANGSESETPSPHADAISDLVDELQTDLDAINDIDIPSR